MKNTTTKIVGIIITLSILFNFSVAETFNDIKISGYAIADYYYIHEAAENVNSNYKPSMMRQVYTDERSGYQFRRLRLTFDKQIEEDFFIRVRFDMNNTDFSYSKMTPGVKDAYLKWQFSEKHSAIFGISGSPAFAMIEKFWGYRKLEKISSDYFGIRSSKDFGISLNGKLKYGFKYHFFTGNGESNASERYGRIDKLHSLSISQDVGSHFLYEFYTDYRLSKSGKYDEFTGQVLAGYKNDIFRIGLQYTYQENKLMKSDKKGDIQLISVPFVFKYMEKLNFMIYYSYYTVSEEQNYIQQAILGGFEYKLRNNVSIMPNIIFNDYDFNNAKLYEKDVVSRITLTYSFK